MPGKFTLTPLSQFITICAAEAFAGPKNTFKAKPNKVDKSNAPCIAFAARYFYNHTACINCKNVQGRKGLFYSKQKYWLHKKARERKKKKLLLRATRRGHFVQILYVYQLRREHLFIRSRFRSHNLLHLTNYPKPRDRHVQQLWKQV